MSGCAQETVDLEKQVLKILNEHPFKYFNLELHKKQEYKDFNRMAMENLLKYDHEFDKKGFVYVYYFNEKLNECSNFEEFTSDGIRILANHHPIDYFNNNLHEDENNNKFTLAAIHNILSGKKTNSGGHPVKLFFQKGLHKNPEFVFFNLIAAEKLAENEPKCYFDFNLDKYFQYKEYNLVAARNLAAMGQVGYSDVIYEDVPFFYYELHENAEYEECFVILAKQLSEYGDPSRYFQLKLHEREWCKEFNLIAAKRLAGYSMRLFFQLDLHKVPEFKSICTDALKNL